MHLETYMTTTVKCGQVCLGICQTSKTFSFWSTTCFLPETFDQKKNVSRISASTSYLHTLLSWQGANRGKTVCTLPGKHRDAKLLLCIVASETSMDKQPCGIPRMLARETRRGYTHLPTGHWFLSCTLRSPYCSAPQIVLSLLQPFKTQLCQVQ